MTNHCDIIIIDFITDNCSMLTRTRNTMVLAGQNTWMAVECWRSCFKNVTVEYKRIDVFQAFLGYRFLSKGCFFSPPLRVLLIAAGAPCCHTLPISMLHNFVWRIIMVMMMMEVMMNDHGGHDDGGGHDDRGFGGKPCNCEELVRWGKQLKTSCLKYNHWH